MNENLPAVNAIESALVEGDLSKLNAQELVSYYMRVCESVKLNPLTKPFAYLRLNGKLVLYALKDAADQIRQTRGVSITDLTVQQLGDMYVVRAVARDKEGRTDVSTGVVTTGTLKGDALANAMMKAETKAKRRVTLSLGGLGILDESEVGTIPGAVADVVDVTTGEMKPKAALIPQMLKPADDIEPIARHTYEMEGVASLYATMPEKDKAAAKFEAKTKYGARFDAEDNTITTKKPHPDWAAFEIKPKAPAVDPDVTFADGDDLPDEFSDVAIPPPPTKASVIVKSKAR